MKAYLIDVVAKQAKSVEIGDDGRLSQYYKLLNCSLIDIAHRKIGGKYFDIILDDEGTFADNPIVSAIDVNGDPAFVGSLLFCNHNSDGEETSLTDEEIQFLRDHTQLALTTDKKGKKVDYTVIMTDVDY